MINKQETESFKTKFRYQANNYKSTHRKFRYRANNYKSTHRKFCYRANNYKSTYRKFSNKKKVSKEALRQNIFHEHFCSIDYSGTLELVITLIEQFEDK